MISVLLSVPRAKPGVPRALNKCWMTDDANVSKVNSPGCRSVPAPGCRVGRRELWLLAGDGVTARACQYLKERKHVLGRQECAANQPCGFDQVPCSRLPRPACLRGPGSEGGAASFSSKSTHGEQASLECTRAHRASEGPPDKHR